MKYMINVDLEILNVAGRGKDCSSAMHKGVGPHYDLTIHRFDCPSRTKSETSRPPERYWEPGRGKGFSLPTAIRKLRRVQADNGNAQVRTCRRCQPGDHILMDLVLA